MQNNLFEPQTKLMEEFYNQTASYAKTTFELTKLKTVETATNVAVSSVTKFIILIPILFFVMLFNIGMALWIGSLFEHLYFGFFIVSLFYLIVGLVLHKFLFNLIKKPLSDFFIAKMLQ